MTNFEKYSGIFPAFYACYDSEGNISEDGVRNLTEYFVESGVQGLYVGGSSGECIYQSVEERKLVLETVMDQNKGRLKIIAHVACNSIADSQELAAHAEDLGVDAIAAIPPIYFKLPGKDIARYWNDISAAAPNTDFIIYNIPVLAGVALTVPILEEMVKNPRVVGVKNSSAAVQDIQMFRTLSKREGEEPIVFNGPDEQLFSGLAAGACGGIGGTYGLLPELYVAIYDAYQNSDVKRGLKLQDIACDLIYLITSTSANMYSVIKAILAKEGLALGSARPPLAKVEAEDEEVINLAHEKVTRIREQLASGEL